MNWACKNYFTLPCLVIKHEAMCQPSLLQCQVQMGVVLKSSDPIEWAVLIASLSFYMPLMPLILQEWWSSIVNLLIFQEIFETRHFYIKPLYFSLLTCDNCIFKYTMFANRKRARQSKSLEQVVTCCPVTKWI